MGSCDAEGGWKRGTQWGGQSGQTPKLPLPHCKRSLCWQKATGSRANHLPPLRHFHIRADSSSSDGPRANGSWEGRGCFLRPPHNSLQPPPSPSSLRPARSTSPLRASCPPLPSLLLPPSVYTRPGARRLKAAAQPQPHTHTQGRAPRLPLSICSHRPCPTPPNGPLTEYPPLTFFPLPLTQSLTPLHFTQPHRPPSPSLSTAQTRFAAPALVPT